ncbi:hypothetical protein L7F22_024295 [Adiantum nelumboides]|nr:hypothetical protein [Adiantum nelumboides]
MHCGFAMDGVSGALGIAAAPYTLLQTAIALRNHLHHLRHNAHHRHRLQTLAHHLIHTLRSAELLLPAAANYSGLGTASLDQLTHHQLLAVLQTVQSISFRRQRHRLVKCIVSCFTASDELTKLQEAERKLENLMTQVVVIEKMLQTIPTVCHETMELPLSSVGLDRAASVLDFLQRTSGQLGLRVICIHGQPGVGKTTLLNYIWQYIPAAFQTPFYARAYAQIGHDATPQMICKSQSSLLRQLGGANREFPSNDIGRAALRMRFQELKASRKPMFLAIDNIFQPEHLEQLFPSKLTTEIVPMSSCIVVTCRNYAVVEALLSICHLQVHDRLQVFCFEPPCLNLQESKKVFAECAGMHPWAPEHQDLLSSLVPLCGGLPLAVTVMGKMFVDEARRETAQWKLIQTQWAALDVDDEDIAPVRKALQLSYDRLAPSRQEAFSDIVTTFYGCSWEAAQRIVGEAMMRDLSNSSLITKVDSIHKCNRSALPVGYDPYLWDDGFHVAMHDLTLRFGKSILRNVRAKSSFPFIKLLALN